jgi:hypothetical protein
VCEDNIQTHREELGVKVCIGFNLFRNLCLRSLKLGFHTEEDSALNYRSSRILIPHTNFSTNRVRYLRNCNI